ncbi:MAG: GNAT family N-acetyltransferase, partial [Myxococcales bacterium]|nr:GNAT family N-acetyltransferase [Myxococcales bacterium]
RATGLSEALAMLEQMIVLHQRSWIQRGQPGSFASPGFTAFHRELIRRAFPTGAVQILRISTGELPIGFLYNFVHRGKVSFYQCGYNYDAAGTLQPGLVAQTLAIQDALAGGFAEYDMMAGEQLYKKQLAKDHRLLHWVILRRRNWKMRLLVLANGARRRLKAEFAEMRLGAVGGRRPAP